MRAAKQIVFPYNGDPTTEESDLNMERSEEEPFAVPIYRVSLANEL
jgi:hypothetical protein